MRKSTLLDIRVAYMTQQHISHSKSRVPHSNVEFVQSLISSVCLLILSFLKRKIIAGKTPPTTYQNQPTKQKAPTVQRKPQASLRS